MAQAKHNNTFHRATREDIAWINSLAIPCVECGYMHWDAYHNGKCAGCSTIEEMEAALRADGYIK